MEDITLSGVAYTYKRMLFDVIGNMLCVTWTEFPGRMCFDVSNPEDCEARLRELRDKVNLGFIREEDYLEIRERVSTLSHLVCGGGENINPNNVFEAAKVVFRDGQRVVINTRKRKTIATQAQIDAANNASKYAHTSEADAKRAKSLSARREAKMFGDA